MSDSTQQPNPSPDSTGSGGEEIQPFVITLPDDPASGSDWYLWAAVLALIVLVAFWPAINGTFLWDDDQYVTQNRALQDASGLKEIWKIPPGTIQYYPLTFTALWIEHQIWGNNSLGYRVVNLLLHAGSAIVLWRILRRLEIPGAWVAAAIWAVHPLQAESVCWISECKNVLSGILALGAVLFYLEFSGIYDPALKKRTWNLTEDWQCYLIAAGLFLLAMLAKTSVVFVPIAILVVLWWKGRLTLPRVLGAAPMLIIGMALGWETSRLETDPNGAVGAFGPDWQLSFVQRLLISGRDFWFYIGKLLLPIHQSFVYPRIVPNPQDAAQWVLLLAAVIFIVGLFVGVRAIGRGPLAAVLCYLLLIFPALGFFNVYPFRFSFVADHFQYLAGISLIVLAVSIIAGILGPLWKARGSSAEHPIAKASPAIAVFCAVLLVVMGSASWIRADVFSEPTKLWSDVLLPGKNPGSWLAGYNLARSRQADAKAGFDEAARLLEGGDADSSKEEAQGALASLDDSDQLLQKVLDNPQTPDDVRYKAHDQWAQNDVTRLLSPDSDAAAIMQHAMGQLNLAMGFQEAAKDPLPAYTLGIVNLNLAQALQKKVQPATREMSIATTTRPNSPDEQRFIDLYLTARDNFQKAIKLAEAGKDSPVTGPEAARVLPLAAMQSANIDWTLGELALEHGNKTEERGYSKNAVDDYALAVRLNPTNKELRYRLALALENVNDLPDAKAELMTILRDLDQHDALAYNEIGRVILAAGPTSMDEFHAAVEAFKAAIQLDPHLIGAQRNLDMAMRMLATTRPATRATTQTAAGASATAPSSMP